MSQSTRILTRLVDCINGHWQGAKTPRPTCSSTAVPRHALLHSRDTSLMAHCYNITNKRKIAISKYKKSTNVIHVTVAQMCSIRLSLTFPKYHSTACFYPVANYKQLHCRCINKAFSILVIALARHDAPVN